MDGRSRLCWLGLRDWIRNICYELDLFCCIGEPVKNRIAVARGKALLCPSWLGLVSGPDYLASDGRSGTRWMLRLWPLIPLTLSCLIVLCGGHNMFFYAEQIYLSAAYLLL